MAKRFTYTKEQLDEYFDRVCLPKARRIYDVSSLSDDEKLKYLNLLTKHQLCKIPWENVAQHYSWHRTVSTSPRVLFKKIVHNSGRGGYCMEVNSFAHLILNSVKFDAHMVGSRIHHPTTGMYGGFTHVVNIVTIAGKQYLIDGGFGPQGPPRPVLVTVGLEETQISPAQMRLAREPMTENLDPSQKVWKYQYRKIPEGEWSTMYCFVDLEFTPADVESMNFDPWKNPQQFFTHKVVAVRFTTDREVSSESGGPGTPDEAAMEGEIDGAVMLNNDKVSWRRHGESVARRAFTEDHHRVQGLEDFFGMQFTEEDKEAIDGTASWIGQAFLGTD